MRGDLGDNENGVVRITADSACCVDRGNCCDVAKDKREEAVATSLFLYILAITQSSNNILPHSNVLHYSSNNPQDYTFA